MNEEIKNLQDDVKEIMRNHLPHLHKDIGIVKTDLRWIKKFFWVVASASISGLIIGLIQLLI